jgi:hypothetical protein
LLNNRVGVDFTKKRSFSVLISETTSYLIILIQEIVVLAFKHVLNMYTGLYFQLTDLS